MIADRYLDRRYNQGKEEGREETLEHTRKVMEKAGIELTPEVREQLRNVPNRLSKQ